MIISIASGKGGTGKTTIATSLAVSVDTDVQLLDCDVEEPNAHLFINPVFVKTEVVSTPVPVVDDSKCSLCDKCDEICQFKAIARIADTIITFPELCHSCGGCWEVCPEAAIEKSDRRLGDVQIGHRNGLAFVHGRLRVGEAMAPPLIEAVRSYTNPDMLTIIDAPPGTSCPVIAAMHGADFILLVTEPTPFGLHDLKLAVGAVNILGIPCGLVINRSDIGDNEVKTFAADNNIPILMEIPFDRQVAEKYSQGIIMAEVIPGWKEKFKKLYEDIQKIVY
ncbi:MAG: ATP-binding protein [Deltaproteobacteria bacterium]|nr:ATP-binding protein [Deltaproteobacteria bacterium]